jgi:hypothetical protein
MSVHEQLGVQWTCLAAVAYVFPNDAALAMSVSYLLEGDAAINNATVTDSGRRLPTIALSGVLPLNDTWRVQGSLSVNPPVPALGLNQATDVGLSAIVVRSWM